MFGLDVNGYDNTPEWGYCKTEGCKEEAYPIWLRGDFPDDPDLLLCPKHIGALIGAQQERLQAALGDLHAAERERNDALDRAKLRERELDGATIVVKALRAAMERERAISAGAVADAVVARYEVRMARQWARLWRLAARGWKHVACTAFPDSPDRLADAILDGVAMAPGVRHFLKQRIRAVFVAAAWRDNPPATFTEIIDDAAPGYGDGRR